MTGSDQRKEYIVEIAEIKSGYLEAKNILKMLSIQNTTMTTIHMSSSSEICISSALVCDGAAASDDATS